MQYSNNLPDIPNITPAKLTDSRQATSETIEQARVKKIALATIAEIATTAKVEQSVKLANALIITEGKDAADILASHFNELRLKPTSNEEYHQYYNLIARITREGGDDAVHSIFSHLPHESIKFLMYNLLKSSYINEAPIEKRLRIFTKILEEDPFAREIRPNDFVKYLEDANPDQLLEMCTKISKGNKNEAIKKKILQTLAAKLDKLGLTPKGRLALCTRMLEQGIFAAEAIAINFDKIKLEETKIDSEKTTPEEQLELYTKIADMDIDAFVYNFKMLKLPLPQALKLLTNLAKKNVKNAATLASNFQYLNLNAPLEQRLALIITIARKGEWPARSLAENFRGLDLYGANEVQAHLTLYTEIANQGDDAASELFSSRNATYTNENLRKISAQQRFELYILIAKQGSTAATSLVEHLDLKSTTVAENLELYKQIARQGVLPAIRLIDYFDLLNILPNQKLTLCKEILNQGEEAADALIRDFCMVKLPENDLLTFLAYAVSKGLQKTFADKYFLNSLSTNLAKGQMLIDLLSPPSGLRGTLNLSIYDEGVSPSQSFKTPIAQLLPILNKEPSHLNEADIQELKTFISTYPRLKILQSLIANVEEETKKTIEKNIEKDSQRPVKKGANRIKEEAAFVRAGLMAWVAYTAAVLSPMNPEQIASIADSKVLDFILSYAHPSLRYSFTRTFSQLSPTELEAFTKELTSSAKESSALQEAGEEGDKVATEMALEPTTDKAVEPFTQLQRATFWLYPLTNFGLSPNKLSALRAQIKSTRSLKQISVSSTLAQLLSTITLHGPYKTEEADKIADCIIKALKQPEIVVKTKKKDKEAVKEKKTVKQEPQKVLTKEEQTQKDLAALANILQIFGKEEMIHFMTPANENVTAASFFQNRFKTIFAVKEFEDIQDTRLEDQDKKIKTFEEQYQKTFDKFRDPMALFSYYRATDRLPHNEKRAVQETLNAFVNSVLREDFKDVRYNPKNSAHLTQVFSARPDLEKLWRTPLEPKRVANTKASEADVKETEANLSSGYQVMEIDDPCDLLLIGTEIKGSCQSVFGDPKKNQALTSYLMNGEIKAVAIKQGGKLIARVILRLMWDGVNNCPVLLQEPLFTSVSNPVFVEAINIFAKDKAKAMGVPLLSHEIVTENLYKETVQFLGGFAPVGYSDSSEEGLITHPEISTIRIPGSALEEYDKKETEEGTKPPSTPAANAPFKVKNTYILYDPKLEQNVVVHLQ